MKSVVTFKGNGTDGNEKIIAEVQYDTREE
jgi:hypothetical protein